MPPALQDHVNKVSRPFPIFMINRTHVKSEKNLFLRLQISTACQDISLTLFSKFILVFTRKISVFCTFFSLSTHPVNSIFSVVVRIYKIHVIDEAFFFCFLVKHSKKFFQHTYVAYQSKLC